MKIFDIRPKGDLAQKISKERILNLRRREEERKTFLISYDKPYHFYQEKREKKIYPVPKVLLPEARLRKSSAPSFDKRIFKKLPSREELLRDLNNIEKKEVFLPPKNPPKNEPKKEPLLREKKEELPAFFTEGGKSALSAPAISAWSKKFTFFSWRWQKIKKPFLFFVIFAVAIAMFVYVLHIYYLGVSSKEAIIKDSQKGYVSLLAAKVDFQEGRFEDLPKKFEAAHRYFQSALSQIGMKGDLFFKAFGFITGDTKYLSYENLIKAGRDISLLGKNFTLASQAFLNLEILEGMVTGEKEGPSLTLTEAILQSSRNLGEAERYAESARKHLENVKTDDLPQEASEEVKKLKEQLPPIQEGIKKAAQFAQVFLQILGHDHPRQYLFVFQNNRELRATGGFIGTYAVLDIDQGKVKKIAVDGIYNPDGQLKEKITSPLPLQKLTNRWFMRDANWFADFPTSARKIALFYEKTGGPTVDGVIAVTPTLIEGLLEFTGPIAMPEYGVTVDAQNFVEKTQYEVEINYDREENRPKQFIADLTPKILEKVFQAEKKDWPKIVQILHKNLKEKHILLFFNNPQAQNIVRELHWAGELLPASFDYLSVVNTNIGGHKTDALIKEEIRHEINISDDGSIIDTVRIKRTHQGKKEGDPKLPDEEDWWLKTNYDYVRFYVPKGAILLEAGGFAKESEIPDRRQEEERKENFRGYLEDLDLTKVFQNLRRDPRSGTEIYEESDKTVFANWLATPPEEAREAYIKYRLPQKLSLHNFLEKPSFDVFVQKQSGSLGSYYEGMISWPNFLQARSSFPQGVQLKNEQAIYQNRLFEDQNWGIRF